MQESFGATLPFFALIFCGYIARWWGVMAPGSSSALNNFVLYFALPALFIRTIAGIPFDNFLNKDFVQVWAISGLIVYGGVVSLCLGVMHMNPQHAFIQALASAHGNIGYLGITLVVVLLGETAVSHRIG